MTSIQRPLRFVAFSALALAAAGPLACGEEAAQDTLIEVGYDDVGHRILVTLHPGLGSGEALHVRVRKGNVGVLDCAAEGSAIERIDNAPLISPVGERFAGPDFDPNQAQSVYTTEWLSIDEPTPEMLEEARNSHHTIDICLMRGSAIVRELELDVRRAFDRPGQDGKFDDTSRIASTVAYGEACVAELGEIPFFPKLADGDYGTYDCLNSTVIPTTVTADDGTVTNPAQQVGVCDNPQFIYSLCEASAVSGSINGPRVTSASNEQGTHWVLLCRKSQAAEGQYNDIAMIGSNPFTGRTCFFQNALYSRTDGRHVPHPADKVETPASPQQSATLWEGIHGGIGSGISCARCHDADPFIHTPWIDGALRPDGDPVVPKMGLHDDFQLGFNKAPYSIINQAAQGWTMPKVLVSDEAAACTKCHRIGDGEWADSWLRRLDAGDPSWDGIVTAHGKKFENYYWMPPDVESLSQADWAQSEFGKALDFIQACSSNPGDPKCKWEELPTEQLLEPGELPEVTLQGSDLAKEAVKVIGGQTADAADPRCQGNAGSCATRRCAECHSVSKSGLRHWEGLTRDAHQTCNLNQDPEQMDPTFAKAAIDCLRAHPEDPASVFAADKLGVLATGVQYGYFRKLFRKAYGDAAWLAEYLRFKARVSMPKGSHPALSQAEYATLKKWFDEGLPNLQDVVSDPPPPSTCEDFLDTTAITAHLGAMRFDGWAAVNEEAGIRMQGCDAGKGVDCFVGYTDHAATWGDNNAGSLKEVVQLGFRTSFWTRSSADGRYVANGGGTSGGATITDLVRNVDIKVKASYDPGFFPDNSGFIFQGGGTGICQQSMLATATDVTFDEPGCVRGTGINLYQHVARGVNGGDYFIINSQFTSDSGGSNSDPAAYFNADSTMKFSPMIFNGSVYEQLPAVIVDSPFEGDSVLSPSGRLVISRQSGPNGVSLGYVIRAVDAQKTDKNYRITIEQTVARACFSGAKANISYDERFMITHHYENDVSNIYMVDLLDGTKTRITNMPAGTKALFPHFRSDGWFYFLVRGGADVPERVLASDAALRAAVAKPLPVKGWLPIAAALALGCGEGAREDSVLDFPSQGASGKEDAFGRKLLGIAASYPADTTLAASEATLKSDMAARRAAAWAIARRVLEPVPLLGLADGAAPEGVPADRIPKVPRFQTWYGVEDFKRMFVELYGQLGAVGRAERTPFTSEQLDAIEAWNAAALDRSNRWPLERYLDYVEQLGACPEEMPADECARLQQSQFSGAAAGNARITYGPATVRHLLENYVSIVDCLEGLGALPLSASPAEGNFTYCFDRELPVDAVLVKAQWVRSDFGRKVPTFDTDAEALGKRIGPTQSADWAAGERETDPGAAAIYTTRMKNGDTYRLAALHVMTKELRHWTWVTLWWSDTPASDFGEDRPASFGDIDPVWSSYKLCAVVDYLEGDADPAARFAAHPSLAAALAVPGAGPSWCSNPYVEHGRGNARTNCIGCHQHGGSLAGHDLDQDGRPDPFVLERVIDSENLFPNNGRSQIREVFPTDYLWSTLRVDDIAHVISHEVATYDALDKNDPDVRALRVVELEGDAARGGQIFADTCARCHGADGRGTIDAPSLYERVPGLDDEQIARTLIAGKNGRMPAWGSRFDDQALADLLAHLKATFAAE